MPLAVKNCSKCYQCQVQRAEPLQLIQLPSLPWQRVETDLFEWKKQHYLLLLTIFHDVCIV